MTSKRIGGLILGLALPLALAACAAGSADSHHALTEGPLSQIVLGFWHGLIAPITLIVEVVNKLAPGAIPWHWRMYELDNVSVAYDVGFYFGLAGGPSFVFTRRYRRV